MWPMHGKHSCTSSGTCNAFEQPKISFYHETPPRPLLFGVVVCCQWPSIDREIDDYQ